MGSEMCIKRQPDTPDTGQAPRTRYQPIPVTFEE
ncbi:hypothetical protein PICSAR110_03995 [Mycobacterium avium subsp. paratuberculosis]|nr:hypothetical protein PICSAR110_03995 [Mycobacterium avium subsp. paratuberculosis]